MWIGVLWAGLRVAMWITHVGGTFRHGLLEKALNHAGNLLLPERLQARRRIAKTRILVAARQTCQRQPNLAI